MVDLNPLHLINNVNHAMGDSMASVLEFLGITDPAVDPDGVREIAKKWRALADALDDASRDAGAALEDVVWEGHAAKAFHKRATKARGQAKQMADALRDGAEALDQFADEAHEMITEIGVICVEIAEMEAAGLALSVLTAGVSAAATTIAAGARAARVIALIARIEESGTALARVIRGVIEVIRGLSRSLRALKEVKAVASAGRMAGEGMKFSAFDAALQNPDAFKDPGKLAHVLGEGAALGVGFGILGKAAGKGLKAIKPSELAKLLGKDGSLLQRLRYRPGEKIPASIRTVMKKFGLDPIDLATGEMLLAQMDVGLPGSLPLVLERTHVSSYRWGGWFGRSWASTLDQRLQADDDGIIYAAPDGARLVYPLPGPDATEPVGPETGQGPVLSWDTETDGALRLTDSATGIATVFHTPRATADEQAVDLPLQTIVDRSGHRIDVTYADDGTPVEISHSGGYRLRLERDRRQPRITAIRLLDPDARDAEGTLLLSYGYDEAGNLAEVVNSSGLPLRFTYDTDGRMTSWTDRNGCRYAYTYDQLGRVIRTEGSGGFLSGTLAFDEATRTTTVTNSLGHTSHYEHNEALRLIRETDPLGHVTLQEWDEQQRLTAVTDPLGHTTRYTYDTAGRPTTVTRPDGAAIAVTYNDLGLPAKTVDADGGIWRREYDVRGNLIVLTDPAGATTRYTYNSQCHLSAVTDALGNTTEVECNPAGLPVRVTDPLGNATAYLRDAFGRPVAVTDPLGAVTTLEWTPEGKLCREVVPDGATETWTYDGEGNRTGHTDPLGRTTGYEYGPFDLLVARIDPDGTRYTFTHDHELRLREVTNPQGLTWSYRYDPAGRLASETDFDDRTVTYAHDAAGRTIARTTPLGDVIRYTHDALGHVTAKDVGGALTRYTYDPAGRLVRAVGSGHDLSFTFDAVGRVTTETSNGGTVTHSYDAVGRPTVRITPSGITTTYNYDAAGNRTAVTTHGGHTLTSKHDPTGLEVSRTLNDGAFSIARTWDPAGRLTEQALASHGAPMRSRTYHYRADGYLASEDDSRTGIRQYALDEAGRVTGVTARNWSESYAYDSVGNQTMATWAGSHPDAEACGERTYTGTRLNTAGAVRYAHDAGGRLILRQKTRLSRKPDTWHYTWDAEDRLTSVTAPGGTRWRYLYDPLGRRTAKQRLEIHSEEVVEQTDFVWDGATLCEQATTAADSPHQVTLTWDHQELRPIAQTERITAIDAPQDEINSRFFAIVTDLVGTPTELIDESGKIAWRTRATLWGSTAWASGSTAYIPLRFPGQYFDPETGLHYNYFRHYDPETARYLTPDPLGLAPAPNPVSYVDNPHTSSDPLGLSPYPLGKSKSATNLRNSPGMTTGGSNLPDVNGRWLRGSAGNAGWVPGQVARGLQGREFNSFNDFRSAFWEEVSKHPGIAQQFSPSARTLMADGKAPFTVADQQLPGQYRYVLHHVQPIQRGGGVYDLDNLVVVTPRYHKEILDGGFHFGK